MPWPLIVASFIWAAVATGCESLTISPKIADGGRHLIAFAFASMAGLMLIFAAANEWFKQRRSFDAWLLGLWLAGTLFFAGFVNWTVNARVVLPCLFPAVVLFLRWLARQELPEVWLRLARIAAVPAAAVALLLCLGDFEFARAGQQFARTYVPQQLQAGERVYFTGHWGFQYYMEEAGAEPADLDGYAQSGSLMIYPLFNAKNGVLKIPAQNLDFKAYPNRYGLHTTSLDLNAGFYSTAFGFLPFGFGAQNQHYPPLADGFRVDRIGAQLSSEGFSRGAVSQSSALAEVSPARRP
jgi:hypothetical protein